LAYRNASFHERGIAGALFAPLKWFFGALLVLLALILAAWIIDWVFVFRVWPDGLERLQSLVDEDLAHAVRLWDSYGEFPRFAAATANFLYAILFKVTGIHDMGARFAVGVALSIPDTVVRDTYIANFEAIQVAMVGTQLFGVRLAALAMAMPMFALDYCVASVDGLAQRAVRRACGGRESASLYHRAKYLQVVVLVGGAAASLLLPISIDPHWILLPLGFLLAILARVQWVFYKKHL
jgi:integrating conjugative element membrane protein (TIGR03747 family)